MKEYIAKVEVEFQKTCVDIRTSSHRPEGLQTSRKLRMIADEPKDEAKNAQEIIQSEQVQFEQVAKKRQAREAKWCIQEHTAQRNVAYVKNDRDGEEFT